MWSNLYSFKKQEFSVFEDFSDCHTLFLLLHTISVCQKYKLSYLRVCYDFISISQFPVFEVLSYLMFLKKAM